MRRDDTITRLRGLLAQRLGMTFDDTRDPQLAEILHARATQHGLSGRGYLDRLGTAWSNELAALAEAVTINETYFFRNVEQFNVLAEVVLPERVRARSAERVLRLLSVGCSTGEEAYTLAMVTAERVDPRWDVSITGLDVNRGALRVAAAGRYSRWSLRETPAAAQHRWFRTVAEGVEIDERLRGRVRFLEYNAANDDPLLFAPDTYDVVFCRNLLMYLTPATAAALVARTTRALAPGGYLFLGHTDTLGSRPPALTVQHSHGTFYYQKGVRHQQPPEPRPAQPVRRRVHHQPRQRDHVLHLVQEERFGDALAALDGIGTAEADRPDVMLVRGAVLAHLGDTGRAAAVCRRLLDRDALNPDAHHLLAECLEGDGETATALEHHRMAAHLDAGFAMPRLRLGLIARRRGDLGTAERELDRAVTLLRHESDERILLFGGGFGRGALIALCHAELAAAR
ncbi:methyltransferase domain-containing protein [Dactylosporangium aurantiacum]|uniref:Methyltransferase domain-containing protein n=1 Tax=Dactylosporangium aurantiacum TaxID=35754 RepID=A0A9Q9IJI2_9ACTN|nr:CheR family methyltransferase [Dactylosporangium aurantiacum]MDG6109946.1 methyltransferase domain-containing protein [Dactylosporangium aurantiacum]UWZ57299.1 methyltransferase domain-containing protein [Dactylosporangium aurantiacum]